MRILRYAAGAFFLLLLSAPLHASTITQEITFSGSGTVSIAGNVTVTYDPSVLFTDFYTGIQVNSLNFTPDLGVGFELQKNGPGQDLMMIIGGKIEGVAQVGINTTDFYVLLDLTTQTFRNGTVATPQTGITGLTSGTATFTTVTPEPSSLTLLFAGTCGLATATRRRWRTPKN